MSTIREAFPWASAFLVFVLLVSAVSHPIAYAEASKSPPWVLTPNATCPILTDGHEIPASFTISLATEGQTQSNWCWAASGRMVMRHFGVDVQQWAQANHALGRTDCEASPSACNSTGWPDFGNYGFNYSRTASQALSWNTVVEQIACFGSPIAFSWAWNGGGGHMQVLYGYLDSESGDDWVLVHDPLPCCDGAGDSSWMLYSAYVSGSGYTHWDDFYHVRPR